MRAGQTYAPPDYVAIWEAQYKDARRAGNRDTKSILAHMRSSDGGDARGRRDEGSEDPGVPEPVELDSGREPPVRPPTGSQAVSGGEEDPVTRLSALFSEQSGAATPDQRASVRRWQGKDDRFYREVQRAVSGQDAPAEALDVAEDLQDLMAPLPENVDAWRGIRNVEATFGLPQNRLEELIDVDLAIPMFFATTLDRSVAETEFTQPVPSPALYKIAAQEGSPVVWVPPLGGDDDAYQQELLFPPGVVMRILRVDRSYSVLIVEVEVRDGEVGR